jgi:beta-lactamase regulating signal transducer with metallopeptidase domain
MDKNVIFEWLITSTVTSSILVIIIFMIKKVFNKKLTPAFHYYIWVLLIVKLLIPKGPASTVSLNNILKLPQESYSITQLKQEVKSGLDELGTSVNVKKQADNASGNDVKKSLPAEEHSRTYVTEKYRAASGDRRNDMTGYSFKSVLFLIWIAGAGVIMFYAFLGRWRIGRLIGCGTVYSCGRFEEVLAECKEITGVKGRVKLTFTDKISSPSLMGLLSPKIIIPVNIAEKLPLREVKYIILHELCHLKRKDIFVAWVTTILRAVYWFNPFIWYGFYKMRQDCEVSCDAMAVSYLKRGENLAYGNTLVNMLELVSYGQWLPGTTSMIFDKQEARRRVAMIARYKKSSISGLIFGICILAGIGVIGLSGSAKTIESSKAEKVEKHGGESEKSTLDLKYFKEPDEIILHNKGKSLKIYKGEKSYNKILELSDARFQEPHEFFNRFISKEQIQEAKAGRVILEFAYSTRQKNVYNAKSFFKGSYAEEVNYKAVLMPLTGELKVFGVYDRGGNHFSNPVFLKGAEELLELLIVERFISKEDINNEEFISEKDIIKELVEKRLPDGVVEKRGGNHTLLYSYIKGIRIKQGWENYLPYYYKEATDDILNKTTDEVKEVFGMPNVIIRNEVENPEDRKEFWVYLPSLFLPSGEEGDSTGIRLYFAGGKVATYMIDEFNGIDEELLPLYLK